MAWNWLLLINRSPGFAYTCGHHARSAQQHLCFQGPARDDRGGDDWPQHTPRANSRDARVAKVVLILSVVAMLMPFSLTTCVDIVRYATQ